MPEVLPDPKSLREMLQAGILAPSADNRHALHFVVDESAVRLIATDRAAWAEWPHRRFLGLLAFGAVLENIRLASAARGWALQIDAPPAAAGSDQVAMLHWSGDPPAQYDPLADAIESRHTNRRFYRRRAVATASLARLQAEAAVRAGGRAQVARHAGAAPCSAQSDPPGRDRALSALCAACRAVRRRALRDRLAGHRRPRAAAVGAGSRTASTPPFALMRDWRWMRRARWLGAHHAFGLRASWLPCALSPRLGLVLSGPEDDDATLLDAGAAFQRVWLAAAAKGSRCSPWR